ncbi:protein NRT1/ PTR FAMILY 5.2-like [Pyrus ussuriensis x Pyrus communis]|uniref:Protein NRT1/ PTR FAMILY 5.2-like n=1 Tax=Pyrus ussuriensis x Pyrus communis TaxID=2448454 RepID=A0A5N5FKY4_9ROSA|nr:protein NRT1/ PTR FAMILY 5.2-like [Pyrus ussuriensis x Pyrus communis]
MKVEKAPLESYAGIGGWDAQIQEIKEAVELPLTHPELYEDIGIRPPKGVILYGVPETGKISLARAVANSTLATFLRVVFSPKFSISPSHLNSQVEFTSHAKTEFANPSPSNFTHTANRWVSTQVSSRVQSLTTLQILLLHTESAIQSASTLISYPVPLQYELITRLSKPQVHIHFIKHLMAEVEEKGSEDDHTQDGTVDLKGYEVFERMAYFGIASNFVIYVTKKLHEGTVTSANNVTNWVDTVWMTPLLGAYIADAYLGRYWTFVIASAIYLVFAVLGIADSFVETAKIELFYDQAPEGVKSLGTSYFTASLGIGIWKIIKQRGRGWILDNLNVSHFDYYYLFWDALSTLNLLFFLLVAKYFVYNADATESKGDFAMETSPSKPSAQASTEASNA